jgi:N-acetyl-gamma-glutamyl-phosphate reductase
MTIPPLKIGIIGAAGYTGGELIRLLLYHPKAILVFAQSNSQAGKLIADTHRDLLGQCELRFTAQPDLAAVDMVFLCTAHGEARQWIVEINQFPSLRIIDLSTDFRPGPTQIDLQGFVYGLPELQAEQIKKAQRIANPGCFATAIQLALLPLAAAQSLPADVFVTGITGATGAGQSLQSTSHFPWRANNISAYKTLQHQHLGEIGATLSTLQTTPTRVHFVPWRGDFTRGIFVSCTVHLPAFSATEVKALYQKFAQENHFIQLSDYPIDLKMAVNTNFCLLQLEQQGEYWVIHAALDNLLKGASGQAVQNMNLMMGWPEDDGLRLKATYF